MKRTLIPHGDSSLTVSIPRKFVKDNNLQKGQEVNIEEVDNGLFISINRQKQKRAVSIDLGGRLKIISKVLGATYKAGYNEINVHFSTIEELRKIKEMLQRQFEGYKVMHQDKHEIVIKKITEDDFDEFNNAIRRFFQILNTMGTEMLEGIKKNDFEELRANSMLKMEVDGLADFCRRAINLKYQTNLGREPPMYVIIEELEKVSDNYKLFCLHIADKKSRLGNDLQKLTGRIVDLQQSFYNLFFKFEIGKVNDFLMVGEEVNKEISRLLNRTTNNEQELLLILSRILNIIVDLNGPLMAVCI